MHNDDDEFLWQDMTQRFRTAYAHDTKQQDATKELLNLTMGQMSPDEYIAKFNALLAKAEWGRQDLGSIAQFKSGISVGLHRAMLARDHQPITMDEWQEALCTEVSRRKYAEASLRSWTKGSARLSTRENLYRSILEPRGHRQQRDPNAMDVDLNKAVVKRPYPTAEERAKLRGKCYYCKKPGHTESQCFKKAQEEKGTTSSSKGKEPQKKPQVQAAKVEEVINDREDADKPKEEPPSYDTAKIEAQI